MGQFACCALRCRACCQSCGSPPARCRPPAADAAYRRCRLLLISTLPHPPPRLPPCLQACGLPDRYVPNMLLAVLWASQANAVPTAFWTLGFLLLPENKGHLQAVVDEAVAAVNAAGVNTAEVPQAAAEAGRSSGGPVSNRSSESQQGREARGQGQQDQQQQPRREENGTAPLLTEAQQRGLVGLACDRRSKVAAAVAEAMRLRSFRQASGKRLRAVCITWPSFRLCDIPPPLRARGPKPDCLLMCQKAAPPTHPTHPNRPPPPLSCSIDVRIAAADCVLPSGDGGERHSAEPGVLVRKVTPGLPPIQLSFGGKWLSGTVATIRRGQPGSQEACSVLRSQLCSTC